MSVRPREPVEAEGDRGRAVARVDGDHVQRAVELPRTCGDGAVPRDDDVAIGRAERRREALEARDDLRERGLDARVEVPAVPEVARPAIREVADAARAARDREPGLRVHDLRRDRDRRALAGHPARLDPLERRLAGRVDRHQLALRAEHVEERDAPAELHDRVHVEADDVCACREALVVVAVEAIVDRRLAAEEVLREVEHAQSRSRVRRGETRHLLGRDAPAVGLVGQVPADAVRLAVVVAQHVRRRDAGRGRAARERHLHERVDADDERALDRLRALLVAQHGEEQRPVGGDMRAVNAEARDVRAQRGRERPLRRAVAVRVRRPGLQVCEHDGVVGRRDRLPRAVEIRAVDAVGDHGARRASGRPGDSRARGRYR